MSDGPNSSGELLGPYRLLRELARGGMGVVYEAVHEETRVHYALKTLLPELLGGAVDDELKRFRREAEAMGRLRHANVARVHAAELGGRVPYLVQDLLSGGTLQDRIKVGSLAIADALEITVKLGSGLQHCHEHGILHRDLKPSNVLFDERGEPQLVDFGLAYVSDASARLTLSGDVMGTPSHMAPEQATGSRDVDARTDVYGLGALLYHSLVGAPPFRAGSLLALLAAVTTETPAIPSARRADVPPWLDSAVLRALAKRPEDRFESVGAFVEVLRRAGPASQGRRARSRRILGAAVVFAFVFALTVVGAGLDTGDDPPVPKLADSAGELAVSPPASPAERVLESVSEADESRLSVAIKALAAPTPKSGRKATTRQGLLKRFGSGPLARWSTKTNQLVGARFIGATLGELAVLDDAELSLLNVRKDFKVLRSWPIGSARNHVFASSRVHKNKRLAVGQGRAGQDGLVWWCDLANPEGVLKRAEFKDIIYALAFSPSGEELAIGCGRAVYIWAPPSAAKLVSSGEKAVCAVAFGAAGNCLAVARGEGGLGSPGSVVETLRRDAMGAWIRDGSSEELGGKPSRLASNPSGTAVALGDQNYRVRLFPLDDLGNPSRAFVQVTESGDGWTPDAAHRSRVSGLRFSGDGTLLFSSSGSLRSSLRPEGKPSEISVWRVKDSKALARRVVGEGEAFVVDFDLLGSNDEVVLLTFRAREGEPQTVELWWRDSLFERLVGR